MRKNRTSIKFKLISSFLGMMFSIIVILSILEYAGEKKTIRNEIIKRGVDVSTIFTRMVSPLLFSYDYISILDNAKALIKESDILSVLILDRAGKRLIGTDPPGSIKTIPLDAFYRSVTEAGKTQYRETDFNGKTVLEFASPIEFFGKTTGIVRILISLDTLKIRMGERNRRILVLSLIMTAAALFLATLLARLFAPVQRLVRGTDEISRGNLDYKIPCYSGDEIGVLTESFNRMAESLRNEKREKEKLIAIIESTTDFVGIASPDGNITYLNRAGRRMVGWGDDENLSDRKIRDVHPEKIFKMIEKEWIPIAMREGSCRGESVLQSSDGSEIPVSQMIIFHGSHDGELEYLSTTMMDISEAKRIDRALRESEEKYRSIFKNATVGIFQTSLDGKIDTVNPAMAEILGYESPYELKEQVKRLCDRLSPGADMEVDLSELTDNNIFVKRFETECMKKDGSVIQVSVIIHKVRDESGRLLYLEGMMEDITQRKRLEEYKIAKDIAEAASRSKSELLTNVSHEIRTPLNAITGFSDLLMPLVSGNKQKSYLAAIRSSGKNLLTLINDILDLSKIEAGMMEICYTPVNIRALIKEIEQIFIIDARSKGLEFITDIEKNLPKVLMLDEIRLRQILFNLVGNAVKFTEKGAVNLTVKKSFLQGTDKKLKLIITVEDTGEGIPEKEFDTIFESFKQRQSHDTRKHGGTGLGLSITKRLTEMMNGRIIVSSREGQGSVFQVVFNEVSVSGANVPLADLTMTVARKPEYPPSGIFLKEIDALDDLRMARLKQILQAEIAPGIEALKGILKIRNVENLGSQVQRLGDKYELPSLKSQGERLQEYAVSFDVVNIHACLHDISRMLTAMANRPGTPLSREPERP